jgi:dephospho-CoA kinase
VEEQFFHPFFGFMGKSVVVTGGIATGKSSFIRVLAEEGAFGLFDCDKEVHLLLTSPEILETLRRWFGNQIFHQDRQTLDRSRLGRLVFSDERHRRRLESLLHPRVRQRCLDYQTAFFQGSPEGLLLIDVPLFYENQSPESEPSYPHDLVVVVAARPRTQQQRLMRRSALTPEEASRRIDAQKPILEKVILADVVIWNEGPFPLLREQAGALMRILSPHTL